MHEGNPPLPLFLNREDPGLERFQEWKRADCDEHLNFPQELLVQKITMADKIPFQYLNSGRSGCERLGLCKVEIPVSDLCAVARLSSLLRPALQSTARAPPTKVWLYLGMLIFTEDGPPTVEQLMEEGERRKLLRKRRIELLGEERAKELEEEEDYEREEELLDLVEEEEISEPEEPDIEFRELPSKQQKAYRKRLRKSTSTISAAKADNFTP